MNKLEYYGKEFRTDELHLRARGAAIEFLAFVHQTHSEKDCFDVYVKRLVNYINDVADVLRSDEQNRPDHD